MKIGLDIDDTISANPRYFRDLCQSTYVQNGSVIIISSRSETDEVRDVTTKQLREWDIRYGRLYLFKPLGVVEHLCPYPELDWYQKYIWQKVHYCRKELVGSFYEDEDKVIELFRSHAPEINTIDSKELFNQSLPTRMLS